MRLRVLIAQRAQAATASAPGISPGGSPGRERGGLELRVRVCSPHGAQRQRRGEAAAARVPAATLGPLGRQCRGHGGCLGLYRRRLSSHKSGLQITHHKIRLFVLLGTCGSHCSRHGLPQPLRLLRPSSSHEVCRQRPLLRSRDGHARLELRLLLRSRSGNAPLQLPLHLRASSGHCRGHTLLKLRPLLRASSGHCGSHVFLHACLLLCSRGRDGVLQLLLCHCSLAPLHPLKFHLGLLQRRAPGLHLGLGLQQRRAPGLRLCPGLLKRRNPLLCLGLRPLRLLQVALEPLRLLLQLGPGSL